MRTIAEAARELGVTPRALRHYERVGLVRPGRDQANDYRLYGEGDMAILRLIVVLRRLGVPLEATRTMLADPTGECIDATLTAAATRSGARIAAASREREALRAILVAFHAITGMPHNLAEPTGALGLPPGLTDLSRAIGTILGTPASAVLVNGRPTSAIQSPPEPTAEKGLVMTDPTTTDPVTFDSLTSDQPEYCPVEPPGGRLTDVRIVYLPPATVASSHVVGPDPEERAWAQMLEFIESVDLLGRKPDARLFGFNHPNRATPDGPHGYDQWVTIPDDLKVPAPLTRTHMSGGTYAAHAIAMGDFHEWSWLDHWVQTSPTWESARDLADAEHMFGELEEQLNLPAQVAARGFDVATLQLDLLLPLRPRTPKA